MKYCVIATVLGAMAAFATTPALADPNIDDTHCLIVEMEMFGSKDPALQTAATMGQLYWLGKLDGRNPNLDLESLVIAELPKMTGDYFRAEAVRCGGELTKRGEAETATGKDMQKKGADLMQQENTH